MHDLKTKDVLKIVLEIAKSLKYRGLMLNERYLHHFFSHLLQDKHNSLDLSEESTSLILHPEWPTYKTQTQLFYSQYKRKNGEYRPDLDGKAGFIDFAVGDYESPHIGIEFSLKYGWSNEEIVYDFLKLLDQKNPFKAAISFNVIFRQQKLARGKYPQTLERHMHEAIREAVKRLGYNDVDASREIYLIVTEIDNDNKRRHWHYDRTRKEFKKGLPVVD